MSTGDSKFDFFGYTFRGRTVLGKRGLCLGNPAISIKATKVVSQKVRAWHLNRPCAAHGWPCSPAGLASAQLLTGSRLAGRRLGQPRLVHGSPGGQLVTAECFRPGRTSMRLSPGR